MILKWIGGICIVLGCGSTGFLMAANQRREERYLRMLVSLLEYMVCELQYKLTPLPELCSKVAEQASGCLKKLFHTLCQELEDQISPDASICMTTALGKTGNIPETAKLCLLSLGKSLGKFDIEGQVKGITSVKEDCSVFLDALNNNKEQRLRSYQTLGICAGAGLAILLI